MSRLLEVQETNGVRQSDACGRRSVRLLPASGRYHFARRSIEKGGGLPGGLPQCLGEVAAGQRSFTSGNMPASAPVTVAHRQNPMDIGLRTMKVYLDACALNRPFNDRRQDRIRLEAEAILVTLRHFAIGDWLWVGSEILEFEVQRTRDVDRRARMVMLMNLVALTVPANNEVVARASEIERLGLGPLDSLHAACAEVGKADVLLTTDDRFVNRVGRSAGSLQVSVRNPVGWIQEMTLR